MVGGGAYVDIYRAHLHCLQSSCYYGTNKLVGRYLDHVLVEDV